MALKTFKPYTKSTRGTILGVEYDTVAWTWGIPEEKLTRILHLIDDMIAVDSIEQGCIWTLVGKILNILPIVFWDGGFQEISELFMLLLLIIIKLP